MKASSLLLQRVTMGIHMRDINMNYIGYDTYSLFSPLASATASNLCSQRTLVRGGGAARTPYIIKEGAARPILEDAPS